MVSACVCVCVRARACVSGQRSILCVQMEQLEQKLARELPSSAVVVACRFPFPNWVPEGTAGEGMDTVWLYHARTFQARGAAKRPEPEDTSGTHQ